MPLVVKISVFKRMLTVFQGMKTITVVGGWRAVMYLGHKKFLCLGKEGNVSRNGQPSQS